MTNTLATFLKDRRAKLDPVALGFTATRRRTPGLRREEVAQRANISATWYTWLEQGRGGAASADVLDRIARALMLTDVEREHLFLLGLGRPPEVRFRNDDGVSPRLQRVLDSMEHSAALIRNALWDVVAWNRAATVILGDYGDQPPAQRNILRRMFSDSQVRAAQPDWQSVARYVVAVFRADVMRTGASANAQALIEELCGMSPEFAAMWRDNDVRAQGEGTKTLIHPKVGKLALEYSAFAVDGRPDLVMTVYSPATAEDTERVKTLLRTPLPAAAQ